MSSSQFEHASAPFNHVYACFGNGNGFTALGINRNTALLHKLQVKRY